MPSRRLQKKSSKRNLNPELDMEITNVFRISWIISQIDNKLWKILFFSGSDKRFSINNQKTHISSYL